MTTATTATATATATAALLKVFPDDHHRRRGRQLRGGLRRRRQGGGGGTVSPTLVIVMAALRAVVATVGIVLLVLHLVGTGCHCLTPFPEAKTSRTTTKAAMTTATTTTTTNDGDPHDRHDIRHRASDGPPLPRTSRRAFFVGSSSILWGAGGGGSATAAAAAAVPSMSTDLVDSNDWARELGTTVRTSVVKGAQVMDRIDAQWEAFSDKYHLGSERQKRPGRPQPKSVPPIRPLNAKVARQLLQLGDQAFLQAFPRPTISQSDLEQQIRMVANTVAPSFARSLQMSPSELVNATVNDETSLVRSGEILNFVAYCHYRAYSDLWTSQIDNGGVSSRSEYGTFKRTFERDMGSRILSLLLSPEASTTGAARSQRNGGCRSRVRRNMNDLFVALVDKGLVASIDVSDPNADNDEDGDDDANSRASLDCPDELLSSTFSVALDGDVTLASQLLLQEQGIRLYPNYARFALEALLVKDATASVSVMDYYMDTDYNSDPNKFQVKEVLMNVEIDRS